MPVGQQLGHDLGVAVGALGLEDRALVVVEVEPLQGIEDLVDVLGRRALPVGIFDAQDEGASLPARQQPVVQRRPRAADVQGPGWGRSEPNT